VTVVAVGLTLRILFALTVAAERPIPGDAQYFREMAATLAAGDGFTKLTDSAETRLPTATHPPVFSVLLGAGEVVGVSEPKGQRVLVSIISAAGIACVGLVGRRLAGDAVGLAAAAIAALHPLWIQPAGMLMSESVYLVVVPTALLLALRTFDTRSAGWALATGAAIGVAALTRSEAVMLVVFLGAPVVLLAADPWRRRALLAAAVIGGALLTLTPWVVRNAVVFDSPVLSTNLGVTLEGSNCDDTYYGGRLGGFEVLCAYAGAGRALRSPPPGEHDVWPEDHVDAALREAAFRYVREERGRVPTVVAARLGRTWGVFAPRNNHDFDVKEGRDPGFQAAGLLVHPFVLGLGAVGAAAAWRRPDRARWVVLAAGPLLVTATSVLVYGSTRIRVAAEPSLAVLAAAGLVATSSWLIGRSGRSA
jgi:4-amino-4-deoxy-L-arabinose transferase-like glycosyltransferase